MPDARDEGASANKRTPRYTLRPVTAAPADAHPSADKLPAPDDPFVRAPVEDDDGYDPFSDRPPASEPTYQEDPWR